MFYQKSICYEIIKARKETISGYCRAQLGFKQIFLGYPANYPLIFPAYFFNKIVFFTSGCIMHNFSKALRKQ